jgi:hypothetical protein
VAQVISQNQYPNIGAAGAAGFAPFDARASIAKPPVAANVTQSTYDPSVSPPASPVPAYHQTTPPLQQNPHYSQQYSQHSGEAPAISMYGSPSGGYPTPPMHQQGYSPATQQGYSVAAAARGYPAPAPQQQGYPAPGQQPYQQHAYPQQGYMSELPTERGDGEVRELA